MSKKDLDKKENSASGELDSDSARIESLKQDYVDLFNSASKSANFLKSIHDNTSIYRNVPVGEEIKRKKFLEYFNGGKILDLGCLEGYHINWFEGAEKIYCVDIIDNFFEHIEKNYKENNVECKLSSGYDLSFIEDSYLDFIFSVDSIMRLSLSQYISYFNEFKRTLKPGGRGYIHLPVKYPRMQPRYKNDRPHIFTKDSLRKTMPWAEIEFIDGYVQFGSIALIKKSN